MKDTTNPIRIYALILPGVWLLIGFIIFMFVFSHSMFIILPLFPVVLIWLLGGLVIFIIFIITTIRLWKHKSPRIALVYSLGYILLGLLVLFHGRWLAFKVRFEIKRPYYERVVSELYSGEMEVKNYERVIVDEGPPLRVAFILPGGILDNWCGIVYDPTDEVIKIKNLKSDWSNRDDPEFNSIMRLFGGTLCGVKSLGGHWYLCFFT